MRRLLALAVAMVVMLLGPVGPASAVAEQLAPLPGGMGWWLAGVDADTEVPGSAGKTTVNANGATVTVHATHLIPGHTYTAWLVYFNDGLACDGGETEPDTNCGPSDLRAGNGGLIRLDGKVVGDSGMVTFSGRIKPGDGPERGPEGVVAYDPISPDFHVVLRSHGPKVPSEMPAQIDSFGGGCEVEVGPPPGQSGTQFEIPDAVGECGDVQLFVFETVTQS